jgi:DtxR family transcriptional regulator, Mn-dependent transcriptional regulator
MTMDKRPAETGDARTGDEPREGTITGAMEDFLKAVYQLGQEGAGGTQQIAERLRISGPSVTNMAKRLHELGLVDHAPYQGIALTDRGRAVALETIRHHRLLELYLTESLGFGWEEVHAEAERLEHHLSREMVARIDHALGYPTHDPHGDPIPRADGTVEAVPPSRLSDLAAGESATVARVSDRDGEKLRFLGELGLRPGAGVAVLERFPFDGPLRVSVDGAEHLIGPGVAAAVHVVVGEN